MYRLSQELSEIAGMFAADGCLQKQYLCMWGNIYQDTDYYNKTVGPFFSKTFQFPIRMHEKKSNSVYGFYLCKTDLVKYFHNSLGFPIGEKTYTVRVPDLILKSKNQKLYASFVRGFIDCDGCLNFDKKHKRFHYYPRIEVKCASQKIIQEIATMLNYLSFKPAQGIARSSKENEVDQYYVTLHGSQAIRFLEEIGLNNPAHTTKYKIWKKFGFCPSKTTFEDRRKILKGEISPYSFYGPVAQPGSL